MKMCFNWKVAGGLALAGLAVFAIAPSLVGAAVLPLLIFAICPLSMLLMMRAMSGGGRCQDDSNKSAPVNETPADSTAELARLRAEVDQLRSETRSTRDSSQSA